jgi:quinoprotein glucose dehydrogenase
MLADRKVFRPAHLLTACAVLSLGAGAAAAPGDWPTVGGDPGGMRHSPLAEITPRNVARLQPAWVYHMKPAGTASAAPTAEDRAQAQAEQMGPPPGAPPAAAGGPGGQRRGPGGPFAGANGLASSESIPLVAGGKMFLSTPYGRVVALDPATGAELWVHQLPTGTRPATRGMEYWPGNGKAAPALIFGTSDGKLRAISAADGKPVASFGTNGVVELRTPEVMVGGPNKPYSMSSPPIIFRNVVVTGAAVGEGIGGAIGDVRGWDAATGKLLWTFHSVPREGEPGYDTWGNGSGKNRSGVNVWGLMTVDAKRGIVYMPFGAPANDRVGVDRPGNNLYGTSVVAADAATGKYLWHFQIVHHDIWDNDAAAPPTLFDVRRGGRTIPAVGIESKNGLLFILDRVTGKPIYPIEERPVPKSDVPGEITSPTQPFPTVTEPLSQMSISADQLSRITPEHEAFCKKLVADNNLVLGQPYTPPTFNRPMVYFPGTIGGVNWGGGAFDPATGYYLVNSHNLAQIMQIKDNGKGVFVNQGPVNGRFWDPKTKYLCQAGSWGDMVAVNVNTGKVAWRVPHGVTDSLPEGKRNTGRPSIGGPITTAGGLTFIAGTDDGRFRAFETKTGKEVWTVKLPASSHTNPMSYGVKGKQYVAIVATGGGFIGTPVESDQLVVYALR